MPAYFDAEERKCWRQIVDILLPMGVLTEADGAALEQLVICMLECRDLKQQVRSSMTIKVTSGVGETVDRVHPLYLQWNQARDRLQRLWSVFGLDPLARTSLHTVKVIHPEKTTTKKHATGKGSIAPASAEETSRFFTH